MAASSRSRRAVSKSTVKAPSNTLSRVFGILFISFAILLVALAAFPRVSLPGHLLGHTVTYDPNYLTRQQGRELLSLVKEISEFPSNAQDTKSYTFKREHVGEAQPIVNGSCSHPFLIPNNDRTLCVLPGRLDIAKHFIMTGGVDGLKDTYAQMASRLQSFGRYLFDLDKYPLIRSLFQTQQFLEPARRTCPEDQQFLDPFQYNFIIQVPGQSVATHIDAPYFWGATRFEFPQWLLAAMTFSGLWREKFIDQIQVVGYLHEWQDNRDGEFVYWDQNVRDPKRVPPKPLAGSVVDGSKTVHAASVYMRSERAPILDKSRSNVLSYHADDDLWYLTSDNEPVRTYTTNDLRITIVYRARCFKDEAAAREFNEMPDDQYMQLEDILSKFQEDLYKRGKLSSSRREDRPDALEFAMMINQEYINYPLSGEAIIPFNYCAIGAMLPVLNPILNLLC